MRNPTDGRSWWAVLAVVVLCGAGITGCDDGGTDPGADVVDGGRRIGSVDGGETPDAAPDRGDDGGPGQVDGGDDDPPLPACADGRDNDRDGRVDLDDPGCSGPDDDDELDEARPQCADEVDNDNDGRVDLEDSDCRDAAGLAEAGFDPTRACTNGLDDDGDGWIDFPLDPGCAGAGDDDEGDLPDEPPVCANGIDDDGDGVADWPDDPGCAGRGDGDETDPTSPPACANGIDDDGDGLIDHPDDFGCTGAGEYSELGGCGALRETRLLEPGQVFDGDTSEGASGFEGTCGGAEGPELVFEYRLDRPAAALIFSTVHPETEVETVVYVRRGCNGLEVACDAGGAEGAARAAARVDGALPGTYFVFVDTRGAEGGRVRLTSEVVVAPECRDERDNDGDGRVDLRDPGCESRVDPTEADPEQPPACANRIDDDEDGRTDYPSDPGCLAAGWATEVEVCGPGTELEELALPLAGTVTREIRADADVVQTTCDGAALGPEHLFTFVLDQAARVRVSTQHPGTTMRTAVTVRRDCGDPETEIACVRGGNGQDAPFGAEAAIPVLPPGRYFVIVEADGEPGAFEMSLRAEPLGPPCSDGLDNDEDGLVDGEDPGCAAAGDADEADDAEGPTACANGEDDDGDGRIDHPYDPGCFGVGDDDEADPEVAPACANRFDDDGDGVIDFPADVGCHGAGDDDERDPVHPPACSDAADNDRDGLIDEPHDPGCAGPGDFGEADPRSVPTCANHADDDEDGRTDWPADPGCRGRGDGDEADPEVLPACSNGEDDDGDGVIDYPEEPGCVGASDPDEANPRIPPRCANGFDDDGDGLTDYPDDPGCLSAGDGIEENPPFCGNDEDDDDDGLIDLADPGCESRFDPDERHDPENLPECSDGIDNDEDGAVDWPDDPECRAAGFRAELPACRLDALTLEVPPEGGILEIPEPETPDAAQGSCGGNRDEGEVVLVIRPAERSRIVVATQGGGDAHLYARTVCEDGATEVGCDDDSGPGNQARLELADVEAGAYFVFVDGRRSGPLTVSVTIESLVRACNDGLDNDEDGRVDLDDPGCEHDMDDDEVHDPEALPACGDGADNDGDGLTDYPDDPNCRAAGGQFEAESCEQAELAAVVGQAGGTVALDTTGGPNDYEAGCSATRSPERVIALTLDLPSRVEAEVTDRDPDFDTVMFLRDACDDAETELACDDDGGEGTASLVEVERLEPGTYFIFLEGFSDDEGPADVTVRVTPLEVPCDNGEDDDGDGLVDAADPGCTHAGDLSEADPDELPACGDGVDNDEDGFTDVADLACAYAGQDREDQACAEREAPDITADGGVTLNNADLPDADATSTCGGVGVGDAVYRFRVTEEQAGGTLVASVANEGTAIDGAVVAVRRFCDDPFSEFGCGLGEDGTVRIPGAESGEYYILVDGVGTPRSPSRGVAVPLADDFEAGERFTAPDADGVDHWSVDSGDLLGGLTVWHDNLPTGVSVAPGEREVDVNGLPVRVLSELAAPTVLRVQLLPAGEDTGPVFVESSSSVESGFATEAEVRSFRVGDLEIPYLATNDDDIDEDGGGGFLDDPQVVFVVVPGRADQIDAVDYRHLGEGAVRIRAAIDLPVVLYFVPGYATTEEVTAAIAEDIFQPGDRVSTGDIELTVEVVPAGE